jgi:hypothetical protein
MDGWKVKLELVVLGESNRRRERGASWKAPDKCA